MPRRRRGEDDDDDEYVEGGDVGVALRRGQRTRKRAREDLREEENESDDEDISEDEDEEYKVGGEGEEEEEEDDLEDLVPEHEALREDDDGEPLFEEPDEDVVAAHGKTLTELEQRIITALEAEFGDPRKWEAVRQARAKWEAATKTQSETLAMYQEAARENNQQAMREIEEAQEAVDTLQADLDRAQRIAEASLVPDLRGMMEKVELRRGRTQRPEDVLSLERGEPREKALKCWNCKTEDEGLFRHDSARGDVICTRCGAVLEEHRVHEGDWTRNFEGEENTTQMGVAPARHMSESYSLQTRIAAGEGVPKSRAKKLQQTQNMIEMNLELGREDGKKHTRLAYKDRMKERAFRLLDEVAERLNIAKYAVDVAKSIFAKFRDDRENVHRFPEAVAASLCSAVRRVGEDVANRTEDERAAKRRRVEESASVIPARTATLSEAEQAMLQRRVDLFERQAQKRLERATKSKYLKF